MATVSTGLAITLPSSSPLPKDNYDSAPLPPDFKMSATTIDPPQEQAEDVIFEFNNLPPEVRIIFFDSLVWDSCCPSFTYGNSIKLESRGRLATYRLVCREWQTHFDKYFFHTVSIYQDELPRLGALGSLQRSLIRHLWFRVGALSSTCPACATFGEEAIWLMNSQIMKRALIDLFNLLGTWGGQGQRMTLEISVGIHRFHGKGCHQPGSEYHQAAITKLCPGPISADALLAVPRLNMIKRLVICRQFRNHSWTNTLQRIYQALPELEHVQFEVSVYPNVMASYRESQGKNVIRLHIHNNTDTDVDDFQILVNSLPKRLRHIVFAERFTECEVQRRLGLPDDLIRASPFTNLLPQRENAESLCAFFLREAPGLFESLWEGPVWRNLAKLSVTSYCLGPGPDSERLLLAAASAVRKMPKLQILEVWCGRRGQACLFRYRTTSDLTMEISLRGTCDIPLSLTVVRVWSEVCRANTGKFLLVREPELIDGQLIGSVNDAIYHLGLMLDPRVDRATR
ncbi:hypothetical protein FDECE_4228 [Fusarium decemcellulare]|nr:hypothetical protein FDECE_4228 [Fusarium decemcellulare]